MRNSFWLSIFFFSMPRCVRMIIINYWFCCYIFVLNFIFTFRLYEANVANYHHKYLFEWLACTYYKLHIHIHMWYAYCFMSINCNTINISFFYTMHFYIYCNFGMRPIRVDVILHVYVSKYLCVIIEYISQLSINIYLPTTFFFTVFFRITCVGEKHEFTFWTFHHLV